MYCLKCGREVNEDWDFCSDCITVMEKYPVKPGTAIQLPKRREGAALSRPTTRRKALTADEMIRKLRRRNRTLFIVWVITFLLFCTMCIPGIAHILEQPRFDLGQNYSVITPAETVDG